MNCNQIEDSSEVAETVKRPSRNTDKGSGVVCLQPAIRWACLMSQKKHHLKQDRFVAPPAPRRIALMAMVDAINRLFSHGTLGSIEQANGRGDLAAGAALTAAQYKPEIPYFVTGNASL